LPDDAEAIHAVFDISFEPGDIVGKLLHSLPSFVLVVMTLGYCCRGSNSILQVVTITNSLIVLDPTWKLSYMQVAWHAEFVEDNIDWLQEIVCPLLFPYAIQYLS